MSDTSGVDYHPAEGALAPAPAAAQPQAEVAAQPEAAPAEPAAAAAQPQAAVGGSGKNGDGPSSQQAGPPMSRCQITGLTVYLFGLFLVLVYCEVSLWWVPQDAAKPSMPIHFVGLGTLDVSGNTWLLVLVLITGALGSFVHIATSLADFVGNRQSARSWTLWYLMRAPIGAALAVVVYFVLRAGLLNVGNNAPGTPDPYSVATAAALTGIFAKQAIDKLNELLDVLFRAAPKGGDEGRHDQLKPPSSNNPPAAPKPPGQG